MEIRLHGRGGQGGVTCAKLIAAAYGRLGRSVQSFGDYAGERSGAPVRAYTRVSDGPITNRNKVYHPDHLVVLDANLLGADTVAGLAAGGTLLINTAEPLSAFAQRFAPWRVAVVDATAIARRHGIGTRSVVIVNTTIAGAFARVHDLPFRVIEEVYEALGLRSNLPAARAAWDAVQVREPLAKAAPVAGGAPARVQVEGIAEHGVSPEPPLKTGSWSTQRPQYVEHLAPCSAWCPAGNDVVGFVQALARDGVAAAAAVLRRSTPFPGVCGRVCPAPCMAGCNRAEYDGSVHIRGLERWIADHAAAVTPAVATVPNPQRIAVIGGGPAGLSAAHTLALAGHRVVVLEQERQLGGVLRTGIPEYRLPRTVVDREIDAILALGVEAQCGQGVGAERLQRLESAYDGLILATGLQRLRGLDVPGARLSGIEQGIRFLHRLNLDGGVGVTGHVVVLGGGNTAMDCARSALRAGAARVTVAYRRTRAEMPAIAEEIEEAEQDGVALRFLAAPVAFHGEQRVRAVELAQVDLGEPDATGRRAPVVSDRTERLDCNLVLLALGQSADLTLLPPGWELRGEQVWCGGRALAVVAAGDVQTGDGTVTHAIGSGRRAAGLLLRHLGFAVEPFVRPDREHAVPATDIRFDHFARCAPAAEARVEPRNRVRSLLEVNHGLSDAMEAHRCFSCGHCTRCDTCLVYCPEGIVRREAPGYGVDYSYCKGCGICVEECPRSAMEMKPL